MSGRNTVAAELQQLIEQINGLVANAQRVAESSKLVDPKYFGAMRTMVSLAAGDLDQKGLWLKPETEKVAA